MLGGVFCGIWCDGEYTLVPSRIKIPEFLGKRNIPRDYRGMRHITGGWGGIRTPGGLAPTTVFKTAAFDRSATHPKLISVGLSNLRFCSLIALHCDTETLLPPQYNLTRINLQAFYSCKIKLNTKNESCAERCVLVLMPKYHAVYRARI